jgi:RimJ/RimL family protein N-acetyltransferase
LNEKWPPEVGPDGAVIQASARLLLRELTANDAAFILELLNDPSFLRFIGDKGARTLADARRYIADGPRASYAHHGFGLYLVQRQPGGERIGICGLVKREALHDVDIGFAFLPAYWSQGYALEASQAVMHLARERFGIPRVVAITSLDNHGSMRLLHKIGLQFERTLCLPGQTEPVNLFVPAGGASGDPTVPVH